MREIKFRAWDKKRNVMWEPIAFIRLLQYLFFENFPNATAYQEIKDHFNDIVWLEYTGLKDSQGKEIYEGDILAMQHYDHWVVSWDGPSAIINNVKNPGHPYLLTHPIGREIIGNIYENPDLIKNDK